MAREVPCDFLDCWVRGVGKDHEGGYFLLLELQSWLDHDERNKAYLRMLVSEAVYKKYLKLVVDSDANFMQFKLE